MKTLWSFGDSFAESRGHYNIQYENEWLSIINRSFEDCVHYSTGEPGTSLDFVYNRFLGVYKEIKENDIVIVCLTTHFRKWFWLDKPQETSFREYCPRLTPEENKAIKFYEMYLNKNPLLNDLHLYYFLHTLDTVTKEKNLKTVVITSFDELPRDFIPDFKNIHIAKGFLVDDVSRKELDSELDTEFFLGNDHRHNHMITSNHKVLADKVLDYINNDTPIDLTEGFKTGILTKDIIKDKAFIIDEMFGIIWQIKN